MSIMFSTQSIQNYVDKERQILYDRLKRKSIALRTYIEASYPSTPKLSLEALNGLKNVLENKFLENPNDEKVIALLADVNEKITNEDYLKPNTPDMEYAVAYKNHVDSFVWPTEEEISLQLTEEAELINLKNSL